MTAHPTSPQTKRSSNHLIEQGTEKILRNADNRSEGDVWVTTHHFGIGIWVRNELRERFDSDDVTLHQAWDGLIHEAARRYVEGAG